MKATYCWETSPELRKAVNCVIEGYSFHKAYKKTGVSPGTIKKFYLKYVNNSKDFIQINKIDEPVPKKYDQEITIFTPEQDEALIKCFQEFQYLFNGLSEKECRMLAYQMLISEDMKIPVGWKHGMASVAWLVSFRQRHVKVLKNLRRPNRICSGLRLARARMSSDRNIVWEKKTVTNFYDDLETCFQKYPEIKENKRIYSLDEAYTAINPERNIVNRVNRSDLLTTCLFIRADGSSLPPVVIKPYLPFDQCSASLPGAVTLTGSLGRMTPDLFTEVMHHFVKHSHSSLSNPSILIMDTDLCHLSYAAVTLAKESGVTILTLHPHVTCLLQPLQGEILDKYKTSYYEAMEEWRDEQAKSAEQPCDFGKFVSVGYVNAMTPENLQNGFKKCGISPFDRDLFTDDDYYSCLEHIDDTCIECKLRDDRSSTKPDLNKSYDNEIVEEKVTDVTEDEKSSGDGGEPSESGELKASDDRVQSDGTKMTPPRTQTGQELDKLKRRLIRSVARLIKEKKSEEEVWAELKKECGQNCKTLWLRMRSLTLKKLKRLLDANDRNDFVPAVARMTLTDWLLYDLVLVHEKIDVIDRNNSNENKVLNNLFSLVQRFEIEGRSGDDLAEAWTAATVSYNSKGLQCSPMLMQRRWFQLKELARHKLYQFWYKYRGNERLLVNAKQDPPTLLQRAVALRYPHIITQAFPSWEERVEQKLVIMPEEFEIKMRKKDLMKPSDEAVPDVVIVEKQIDTITLDSDSDFDNDENDKELAILNADDKQTEETTQTPLIVQVKTEPEDIDIEEHSVYPEKPKDRFQDAIDNIELEENKLAMSHADMSQDCMMPLITNVTGAVTQTTTENVSIENNIHIGSDSSSVINKELEKVVNTFDNNTHDSIVIDDDDVVKPTEVIQNRSNTPINTSESNVIDITSPKGKTFRDETDIAMTILRNALSTPVSEMSRNKEIGPIITAVASGSPVKAKMEMITEIENKNMNEDLLEDADDVMEDIIKIEARKDSEMMIETDLAVDGFEFADEGIEYHEENNSDSELNETRNPEVTADEKEGTPKFDLKLLMDPVVYTTKLDEMKVCENRNLYQTINGKHLVDSIILESKPVSAKSIKVDQIQAQNNEEEHDNVQIKVENSHEFDDDLFQNESSNESDSLGDFFENDIKRVKLSSPMLQKPRSRSYNPIQLCKNPDFNTRLKRLSIGFFSSNRNRVFLRACKPMTVDLSKAFESKLVDGTMYLKSSYPDINKNSDCKNDENISESVASIAPSAVAVQSLMNTADVDKILQTELNKRMLERNKPINLPNISLVRQINQNLLMAEVSPIVSNIQKSASECINALNNIGTFNDQAVINTDAIKEMKESHITDKNMMATDTTNHNLANAPIPTPTPPVVNNDHSKKGTITNLNNLPLPMLNNSTSNQDKTVEKQRKKYDRSKQKNMPSWLVKNNNCDSKALSESFLTLDTLYKVLNALDPTSVDYRPKTKNQNKTVHPRPGRPQTSVSKIVKEFNSKQQISTDTTNTSNVNTENKTKNQSINQLSTATDNTDAPAPTKKQRNCCWARTRVNKLKGLPGPKREHKHKCPATNCRCCCKEILRQAEINHEIQLLEKMMQNNDKCDETIEDVVQQSRNSFNKEIPATKPKKQKKVNMGLIIPTVAHIVPSNSKSANVYFTPQSPSRDIGIQADLCTDDNFAILNDVISVPEVEETIDLIDDDENVSPTTVQPPKPKIRVHAALSNSKPLIDESHVQATQNTLTPAPSTLRKQGISRPKSKVSVAKATAISSNLSSKDSDYSDEPCTCRPNVGIDQQSATLVVDGSNECLQHTKSRVSKETRIYLNRKHMSGTARPFYVGKNKILLTNITPEKAQTLPPAPALAPHLELPEGVQVVLLADGQLSYIVDPGVKLTHHDATITMPEILSAIHDDIKGTGVKLPAYDAFTEESTNISPKDVSDTDTTNPSKEVEKNDKVVNDQSSQLFSLLTNDKSAPTLSDPLREQDCSNLDNEQTKSQNETNKPINEQEQKSSVNDSSLLKDKENDVMDVTEVDDSQCSKLDSNLDGTAVNIDDNNSVKESESANTNNTTENENTAENQNTNNSTSRNLISALMEMSGIVEEDITSAKQQINSNIVPEPVQSITIDTFQDSSNQSSLDPAPLSPVVQKHAISAQVDEKVYNLNPITSFAELKYACDNKGLFFKLDLNNGLIVPINVCIQKTPETFSVKNRMPSEVIDLTDDQNVTLDESVSDANTPPKPAFTVHAGKSTVNLPKIKPKDFSKTLLAPEQGKIKKVQTIRVVQKLKKRQEVNDNPTLQEIPTQPSEVPPIRLELRPTPLHSMQENKMALIKRLSNNLKPLNLQQIKRSSINILRKNSLLRNATTIPDRISNLNKRKEPDESDDSSEDSDDEPLAKVAKKMRATDSEEKSNAEEVQGSQDDEMNDGDIDFEEAIDAVEAPLTSSGNPGPVPTQLVLSGAAVEQPLPADINESFLNSFVADDSDGEDSDDGCILGV